MNLKGHPIGFPPSLHLAWPNVPDLTYQLEPAIVYEKFGLKLHSFPPGIPVP